MDPIDSSLSESPELQQISRTFQEIKRAYARSRSLESSLLEAQREIERLRTELRKATDEKSNIILSGRRQLQELTNKLEQSQNQTRELAARAEQVHANHLENIRERTARITQVEERLRELAQKSTVDVAQIEELKSQAKERQERAQKQLKALQDDYQSQLQDQQMRFRAQIGSEKSLQHEISQQQIEQIRTERDRYGRAYQAEASRRKQLEEAFKRLQQELTAAAGREKEYHAKLALLAFQSKDVERKASSNPAMERDIAALRQENSKLQATQSSAAEADQKQLAENRALRVELARLRQVAPLRHLLSEKDQQLRQVQTAIERNGASQPKRDKAIEALQLIQKQREQLETTLHKAEQNLLKIFSDEKSSISAQVLETDPTPPRETRTPPLREMN